MKRVLLIKPLICSIFILVAYYIIFKTELLFTNKEVATFINYMNKRNDFLDATNFMIWLVIISALVVTALNKMDKVKVKRCIMSKSFDDLLTKLKGIQRKKVAVAVAQDEPVLEAVKEANDRGIADAILVGNKEEITLIAKNIGMDLNKFEIVNIEDPKKAALHAVELVSTGRADMLMKGLLDTATFLRSVLNKEVGLRTGKLMSHVAVFEIEGIDRLILLTDAAFNTYPELKDKAQIIRNSVVVAKACGISTPKVAPICAVEVVNENMQATVDAALLSKMSDRGQIKGCIVDGPLALDNALSEEAAHHKGVTGSVAGKADILLLPNIDVANVMYKSLTYTASTKNGGILVGTSAPVILTSRADSFETKVNSIALAALVSEGRK